MYTNYFTTRGVRYYILIEAKARNAQPLIPKKHLIAWEQFELPFYQPLAAKKDNLIPDVNFLNSVSTIEVQGLDFKIVFNKISGFIEEYKVGEANFINKPLIPYFWRAPNDNDLGNKMPKRTDIWKDAGNRMVPIDLSVSKNENFVMVYSMHIDSLTKTTLKTDYSINGEGAIKTVSYTHLTLPTNREV